MMIHSLSNRDLNALDLATLPPYVAREVKAERIRRYCAKHKKGPAQSANAWFSPRMTLCKSNIWDGWSHKMPDGSIWEIPPQTQGSLAVMYAEQQARKAADRG